MKMEFSSSVARMAWKTERPFWRPVSTTERRVSVRWLRLLDGWAFSFQTLHAKSGYGNAASSARGPSLLPWLGGRRPKGQIPSQGGGRIS